MRTTTLSRTLDKPLYSFQAAPHRKFTLTGLDLLKIYVVLGAWILAAALLPNSLWDPVTLQVTLLIGTIGLWRYAWWGINFSRSLWYGYIKFPAMRKKADALWKSGWRPNHVHILMTTYYENTDVTDQYLSALIRELTRDNLTATLWIGYGAEFDREVISTWLESIHYDKLDVVMVKQNQPGKRVAIAVTLRAMARRGVHKDDIVLMMDGDSIIDQHCIQRCASIMGAYPHITALTTDEDAVVVGPRWVQLWLTMRFAQRRMWMQSHAVSEKVLTLTGRMSVFRATAVTRKEFVCNVESDHLTHWLWGPFRFLSGDDKSTWYTLLKNNANMLYIPDAMAYTIEHIEGNGVNRMKENLLRWSGNMLRNGSRGLALGPKKVGFFIWLCIIDQRISIWTVLMGLTATFLLVTLHNPGFLITYFLWVSITRFTMSLSLYFYSNTVYLCYPVILYVNQISSAFIKVYMLFHLPKQRWANRNNQKSGDDVMSDPEKRYFANYVNGLYVALMVITILVMTGLLKIPYWYQLSPF